MYGLINQALKNFINERGGPGLWRDVCSMVGVGEEDFDELRPYPDTLTASLVGALAKKTGASEEAILKDFGHDWISFTLRYGYGEIMDLFGSDLRSCLRNLNRMHGHMAAMMPDLRPPRFVVSEESASLLVVRYFSDRQGLAPMVVGLLAGLADKFQEAVSISHSPKPEGASFEEFRVLFKE